MKKFFKASLALTGLFASTLSYGATISIDFNSLVLDSVITPTTPLELNSFTTLSTTSNELMIFNPMFGGTNLVIGGEEAIFSFDTSAVAVTSVTLTGDSNNAPVTLTTFDLDGFEQDIFNTDYSWDIAATLSNSSPISSLTVILRESEISSMSITYNPVTTVPVPAAVWLFGSGLIGLAGIARRKKA